MKHRKIWTVVVIFVFILSFSEFRVGHGNIALTIPLTANILSAGTVFTVDANTVVNPFSKRMLGVAHGNWEHSWGKYFPGDVPRLADIYKAANIGLIRYAGGLWANYVMWERSEQKTPSQVYFANPANYHSDFSSKINTSIEYNFHYGMNEIDSLAKLARESGAAVMIQVNISKNDPYMWADMVRYANIEKKYGFKYWELGNEFDHECQSGNKDACITGETYQTRAANYISAMKAVDPTIVIVGGVPAAGHDILANNWENTPKLSRYLTAGKNAGADALSYHWYTDCWLSKLDNVFAWKYNEPDTAWQHMYSRYWSALGPRRVQQEIINPSGKAMEMGITELSIDACDFQRAPVNSNHISALWYADIIGRMAYNGIDFVTWYSGYGNGGQGYPAVFTEEDFYPTADTIYLRPSYYAMFLYGNYFGNSLVKTNNPDPEKLSLYASVDSKFPNKLFIMVTNLSGSTESIQINVSGFVPETGKKYVLKNSDPLSRDDDSNGKDHGSTINGYTLTAKNITTAKNEIPATTINVANGILNETIPAYTVTAFVLEKNAIKYFPHRDYVPRIFGVQRDFLSLTNSIP